MTLTNAQLLARQEFEREALKHLDSLYGAALRYTRRHERASVVVGCDRRALRAVGAVVSRSRSASVLAHFEGLLQADAWQSV